MVSESILTAVSLTYFGLLLAAAFYADKRREAGKSIISNPYIYSLSFGVYFTAWSFYGTAGRVATVGLDDLASNICATLLVVLTWWSLLRKMVRISKEEKITSIADFIASRYGKSVSLGALVTILIVLGILPYIALQLKAVAHAFDLLALSPPAREAESWILFPHPDIAFIVALALAIFSVLFGARHLDASHRHEGLIAAIALESFVKLIAFLALGLWVVYGLFNGFSDLFTRFGGEFPERRHLLLLGTEQTPYATLMALTFTAVMSVMFLPRMFHVMVVENTDEEHIKTAMWFFPLYQFLILLFIVPIALGGLVLYGGDTSAADVFVLSLPITAGRPWLAILVFIGGFSAAAGMVMVSSNTLSTMVLNHLFMPLVLKLKTEGSDLSRLLIAIKRLGIFAVIFAGYFYYKVIGESFALVNIGLASFIAVTQLAPPIIGSLYWKRGNLRGAMTGLILGFLTWFYTLLIPAFVRSGWIAGDVLEKGLFGFGFLRPLELFGLSGLDMWSHSLFWTMFFNVGAFVAVSLLAGQSKIEREQAERFVNIFDPSRHPPQPQRLTKVHSVLEFAGLMSKFIGEKQAHAAIAEYVEDRKIDERGSLPDYEISGLKRFAETTLAGSVGAAPAHIIVESYLAAKGSEIEDVLDIFGSVSISRKAGREQLGVLYEASRIVGSGCDLQTILDKILELLAQQFKFDGLVVRIFDEEKKSLMVRSQKGMNSSRLGAWEREPSMNTYSGTAFLTNSVMVVNDTDYLEKPLSARLIHAEGIKSFAHASIMIEGNPIGVLSAFSKSAKGIFSDEFIELFENLAGQVGIAWRNARQTQNLIKAREKERELQIARTIQLGLLPGRTPAIKGISLAGTCVPAHEVGGDYYDFLSYGDKALDLVIADVSGHSVGAALIMGWIRTFIQDRAKTLRIGSAGGIMDAINRFFYEDLARAELFVTMFFLKYDAEKRWISFASAGHNPPLLWRAGSKSCERLDAEGMILGIRPQVSFEEKIEQLHPGDILLLYTDGITEAENPEGAFFGEKRLCSLLNEYHLLPPRQIIDILLEQAYLFGGTTQFKDDVSLVAMRVEG